MSGFQITRWSLIAAAAGSTAPARMALGELCKAYWPPAYAFVRRSGHSPHDAQDLVQSFFARIVKRNDLASVDPQLGRFRSWLLGALKNFLANERRRARARKRGGKTIILSMDAIAAEERHAHEPADALTPERLYERRWALLLLERVLSRLEREYAARGRLERFEQLKGFLAGDQPSYEALADQLGEASGTLRVRICRLRERYQALLRNEIAETVVWPVDVEDELRHLRAALWQCA